MISSQDILYKDFEAVNKISLIPMMLDVICRTTGMGFAAIARVTEDRWLACSVRDEVSFGLTAGAELEIKSTICNEIRQNRQPVIIDHVDFDEDFQTHHTPKMYGLQSYISFPIILKNGEFFGTLCAIDSKPAKVKDPKIMGTFLLFADLLSFHLQSIELMERGHFALLDASFENSQYKQITNHNLQEPLRKIRIYSNLLLEQPQKANATGVQEIAGKINTFAKELSDMITSVSRFSAKPPFEQSPELIDLNKILSNIRARLHDQLFENHIELSVDTFPAIVGIQHEMEEFFQQLITFMVSFPVHNESSFIRMYVKDIAADDIKQPLPSGKNMKFCNILIEHHHAAIDEYYTTNIFDIFIHSNSNATTGKYDAGLANCRKIIHRQGGDMTVEVAGGKSVRFSIILPVEHKTVLNLHESY